MKKKLYLVVIGVAVVSFAVAFVSASALPSTPLYTVRMEQASSKMGFLPTAVNEFDYTTESGYTLSFNISGGHGSVLRGTDATCFPTCSTCPYTCDETCPATCPNTCPDTCPATCVNTCPDTCDYTCPATCVTCPGICTYVQTCRYTCPETCPNTCSTCAPECAPQP